MRTMDGKMRIEIDLNKEKMGIYIGKRKVGFMEFLIDVTQINVVDLTIVKNKQFQGYGRLLINAVKGIASYFKKPIYLIAREQKVEFYEKMGFFSMCKLSQDGLGEWTYERKVVCIKNLNPEKTVKEQLALVDMLWIPQSLTEVDIYL